MKTVMMEIKCDVDCPDVVSDIERALRKMYQSPIAVRELPAQKTRANFLWPHEDKSIEEAGYEFANGKTESYLEQWWDILKKRIREPPTPPTPPRNATK